MVGIARTMLMWMRPTTPRRQVYGMQRLNRFILGCRNAGGRQGECAVPRSAQELAAENMVKLP
ncbi:MAG: hypothetical protein V9E91_08155 [Burkholderiaceae bacterium]